MVIWSVCFLSRSRRLSFPRACVTWPHWFLEMFSGWWWEVMAFRHKRRSHGCRARSGPKWFWQKQLHSMAGRSSGRANSVRNRMCGRGGVAGDVIITSRRRCTGSFSRRSQQSQETGLQAHQPRVGGREKSSERLYGSRG